jgi:hypothetical protein
MSGAFGAQEGGGRIISLGLFRNGRHDVCLGQWLFAKDVGAVIELVAKAKVAGGRMRSLFPISDQLIASVLRKHRTRSGHSTPLTTPGTWQHTEKVLSQLRKLIKKK